MSISQGIFRQYDIRGIVGRDLTDEVATAVGRAYGTHAFIAQCHVIAAPPGLWRDDRVSDKAPFTDLCLYHRHCCGRATKCAQDPCKLWFSNPRCRLGWLDPY